MTVVSVLEGATLPSEEWLELLGLPRDQFAYLCDKLVFRRENLDWWRIALVGAIVLDDRVLFVRPKFDIEHQYELATILKVLRIYFARSDSRQSRVQHEQNPEFNAPDVLREFDLTLALRNWAFEFGVYRRAMSGGCDGGRTDWTRTMARRDPIITAGSAVYPSSIGSKTISVLNEVSDLQCAVTGDLCKRYGLEIPPQLSLGAPNPLTSVDFRAEPHRSYFLRIILAEQQKVYKADLLRLFKLLNVALSSGSSYKGKPQVYGTTAFHSVWEDACRTRLEGAAHSFEMAHPTWLFADGRERTHEQTPDLVVEYSKVVFIIDAKYYFPFPEARPGAPDIVKQISYEEAISSKNKRSLFIIPDTTAVAPRYLGSATIPSASRVFPKIDAWGFSPYVVLAEYPYYSQRQADDFFSKVLSSL